VGAAAEPLDAALYAALLTRHTRATTDLAGTRVDYRGLAASADWKRLLENVGRTDASQLASREERLAYWINVYNIFAIDLVLHHYPVDSIRDIGSLFTRVWKKEAGRIRGRPYTLHEIEHEILRPMFEPRIHAALVCASLSCPALRREPWSGADLDRQLSDTLRQWLADPRKGLAVDRERDTITVSKIFEWFAADFVEQGGVLAFVTRYAPAPEVDWIELHGRDAQVHTFDYDWSLNDLATAP